MASDLKPPPFCPCDVPVDGNQYAQRVHPCSFRLLAPGIPNECDQRQGGTPGDPGDDLPPFGDVPDPIAPPEPTEPPIGGIPPNPPPLPAPGECPTPPPFPVPPEPPPIDDPGDIIIDPDNPPPSDDLPPSFGGCDPIAVSVGLFGSEPTPVRVPIIDERG